MPLLNGSPPQIYVLRTKNDASQGRWNKDNVLAPLLIQLRRPLVPLGGGLLRHSHRLFLIRGFLPHFFGNTGREGIWWKEEGGGGRKEQREEELSLGLRRKNMKEWGERPVNCAAMIFPTHKEGGEGVDARRFINLPFLP